MLALSNAHTHILRLLDQRGTEKRVLQTEDVRFLWAEGQKLWDFPWLTESWCMFAERETRRGRGNVSGQDKKRGMKREESS